MQTLSVGAGQSNQDYQEAEQQRRAELRSDSQEEANYFFGAAALAALGTGLLMVRINIFVSIGAIEMLRIYGGTLVRLHPFVVYSAAILWVAVLAGLGLAARRGHRWAFLVGISLYAADAIALIVMFSIGAFAVHCFFVFRWVQGYKALRELDEASALAA
jgi:hypothetical protein